MKRLKEETLKLLNNTLEKLTEKRATQADIRSILESEKVKKNKEDLVKKINRVQSRAYTKKEKKTDSTNPTAKKCSVRPYRKRGPEKI